MQSDERSAFAHLVTMLPAIVGATGCELPVATTIASKPTSMGHEATSLHGKSDIRIEERYTGTTKAAA